MQPNIPDSAATAALRRPWIGLWEAACELGAVLRACRFSLFIIAGGGALLLLAPQGWELAVRLPDESIWHAIAFHICVFLWAFQCWFWARVLLQLLFSHDRERHVDGQLLSHWQRKCVEHVPRILALLAYAVPVLALIAARTFVHAVIAVLAGILFYTVLVLRRWAAKKVRQHTTNEKVRNFIDTQWQPYARMRDLPAAWMWILIGGVILGLACTAFVVIDPVTFGWALGAAAVPFIGFALLVPLGSLAVYLSHLLVARDKPRAHRSLPAVTIMVVWAVVGGLLADNHVLRTVPDSTPRRMPFDQAVRDWHESAKTASGQQEPPLVIVSAAGGGLRAAYWTATVLGALQDADPNFGKYVFAISGVSGGSLGATVFVTLLGQPPAQMPAAKDCKPLEDKRRSVECAGQQVLAQDFLAPAVAGLLFPDLLHNFFPVFGTGHDRAAALEKGWERAWERAGFDGGIWAKRSFTQLWPDAKTPLPALLLNGVHVATGKRIITSNLSTVDIPIADAYDVFEDMLKVDIPVSTAAHNSARFTYVSPAGTLLERGSGVNHGRVVDGGYFENFGAATARETLRAVKRKLRLDKTRARPFIIQISNDPKVETYNVQGKPTIEAAPHERPWCRNEVLAPICALLKTRDGRGTLAYKEFLEEASHETDYVHFRLCDKIPEPALGWVLSEASTRVMREVVRDDRCDNKQALQKVLAFLKAGSVTPAPGAQVTR